MENFDSCLEAVPYMHEWNVIRHIDSYHNFFFLAVTESGTKLLEMVR